MIIFAVINRLRGTWSWFRPVYALVIALIVFMLFSNMYVSFAVWLLAWIGVAMGWGDWDCVATNHSAEKPIPYIEGNDNGIQWLAEKIVNSDRHWLWHCRVCLILDGIYRALWILPIVYCIGWSAVIGFIALIPMFWLASELGYYTTKLWNFKWMTGGWEHQEVWYGTSIGLTFMLMLA